MSDKQELIRQFAVAIAGRAHISEYLRHEIAHDMIWRIAEFLADGEPPQPADNQTQPEHTREDWWELQGNVTRLTQDVQRLSGTVETLEGRIRRAVATLRGAIPYDTACGYAVSEDAVEQAVQILEEGSDD